jgi:16S rRNA (uracil1498-N3)-methyltransferase
MIPRFYCPFPLAPGASFDLPDAAAHHAARVLRLVAGNQVRLFDGRGGEWLARIERLKPGVHVALDAFDAADREAALKVTLVQGLAAGDKMDWIVQKAVELGVAAIHPVAAKRSVVRLSSERGERRVQHWSNVAVAACEQSGRNCVPTVASVVDLTQRLAEPRRADEMRLVLSPRATRRLRDLAAPVGPVTILIGPEGGFDEGEFLAAESVGFVAVSLGPRVLRTETAGPTALAAMMALWGDL